ncbi:MAG: glycosyltransferase [Chloroflexi bacterium]|nr:glycosyltransferase [Chloroflexota bacterium]
MRKEKLHIAHFTNTYFPVMSGVVRSISTFRQAQEQLGHTVFVFGQDTPGHLDDEPFVFRYPALNIPIRNYPATIPVSPYIDWVLPILKLDIIHAHHPCLWAPPPVTKPKSWAFRWCLPTTRYQEYAQSMGLPEEMVRELIERQLADYMQKCQHIIAPARASNRCWKKPMALRKGSRLFHGH